MEKLLRKNLCVKWKFNELCKFFGSVLQYKRTLCWTSKTEKSVNSSLALLQANAALIHLFLSVPRQHSNKDSSYPLFLPLICFFLLYLIHDKNCRYMLLKGCHNLLPQCLNLFVESANIPYSAFINVVPLFPAKDFACNRDFWSNLFIRISTFRGFHTMTLDHVSYLNWHFFCELINFFL